MLAICLGSLGVDQVLNGQIKCVPRDERLMEIIHDTLAGYLKVHFILGSANITFADWQIHHQEIWVSCQNRHGGFRFNLEGIWIEGA